MGAYIIRRLIMAVIIVVIVTAMVFLVMRMMPGDPILFYLSQNDLHRPEHYSNCAMNSAG